MDILKSIFLLILGSLIGAYVNYKFSKIKSKQQSKNSCKQSVGVIKLQLHQIKDSLDNKFTLTSSLNCDIKNIIYSKEILNLDESYLNKLDKILNLLNKREHILNVFSSGLLNELQNKNKEIITLINNF